MANDIKIRPKGVNYDLLRKKYYIFYRKFHKLYTPEEWELIRMYFFNSVNYITIPLIITQIYSELGIDAKALELYKNHFSKFKSNFSFSQNIIDIGGGRLPAFANMIAEEQLKIGKGTITVYDPKLVITKPKFDNMRLVKEKFTKDTDVSKYDLMLGIFPCEATSAIIESAIKNDKDFYVAQCGCYEHVISPSYFFDNEEVETEYFDGTEYDWPIYIRKKRTK